MGSLQGKVIAITGAASGIGKELSFICASFGAKLSLADVQGESLKKVVSEISKTGAEVIGIKVDVSSSQAVEDWIESTVQRFGRLDGAANLASMEGKTYLPSDLVDTTDEEWDYILSINLTGLMYCVRAQLRVVKEGASIVNVSSLAGVVGRNGISAYSASKHGVIGLTRTVAKDVGPHGIRVNAVAPSPIRTALTERLLEEDGGTESGDPVTTSHKSMAPRQLEQLEEPINLIAFLLSDEASSITGAVYSVDGSIAC
ncbi:hypothetical protein LTS17_011397 [Exophiala oligosperma]